MKNQKEKPSIDDCCHTRRIACIQSENFVYCPKEDNQKKYGDICTEFEPEDIMSVESTK